MIAPSMVRRRWGRQKRKWDTHSAEGKQTPARGSDVHLETAGKPGNARSDQNGEDRQQPDVVQQMNARILPGRARYGLSAVEVRTHGSAALASASWSVLRRPHSS